MCKMCWEHWQFTSVQRTQKLFLYVQNQFIQTILFQRVHERLQLPLHQLGHDDLPAVQPPPALNTLRRLHRHGPAEAARWAEVAKKWTYFTVCGSNLSSSRFVSELWLLSRARPSPLLTNGQWTLWTVRTGGTNARQLLVTLLCCVQCELCWKLCADDWRKLTELTRDVWRLAATWRHLARPPHQHPPAPTISHQPHSLLLIVITSEMIFMYYQFSPSMRK